MIKRRFYRLEHGDNDAPSESSSSDSEVEADAADETEVEEEEEDEVLEVGKNEEASSSFGYEREDSSLNEVNLDSSGLHTSGDDMVAQKGKLNILGTSSRCHSKSSFITAKHNPEKDEIEFDVANCVLKSKSVFKCRLCPRIVCLSEESLKAHLNSKRHARSEKLRKEGRLKLILNNDGEIEGETQLERHDVTTVPGQRSTKFKKKRKETFKKKKQARQKETRFDKARGSTGYHGKRRKNSS